MTGHNGQQHLTTAQLSALLDKQLPIEEREFSDAHLAICEQCQQKLESLRQTAMLLHALPRPELPRSFTLPATTTQVEQVTPTLSPVPAAPVTRQSSVILNTSRRHYYARTAFRTVGTLAAMVGLVLLLSSLIPLVSIHNGSSASNGSSSGTGATTTQGPTISPHLQATTGHETLTPQPTASPSQPQPSLPSPLDISTIAGRAFLGAIFLIIGIIGLAIGSRRTLRRGP